MSTNIVDLETQYSPSRWTKRFTDGDEALRSHMNFVTKVSNENLEKYNCNRNISYGNGLQSNYDIYFKDVEEGTPIFIYVHGGYWQKINKDISAYCVGPIVEKGHRVIILDYDLCPNVTLEQIVTNIVKVLLDIFKYAEATQTSNIILCGHSAGAHLIASAILEDKLISISNFDILKSIILIDGVYDLRDLAKTYVNENNKLTLNDDNIKLLSPLLRDFEHLKSKHISFIVYVAEYDTDVFRKQSLDLSGHLQQFGLICRSRVIPKCDHFDVVENLSMDNYEITKEILNLLEK